MRLGYDLKPLPRHDCERRFNEAEAHAPRIPDVLAADEARV